MLYIKKSEQDINTKIDFEMGSDHYNDQEDTCGFQVPVMVNRNNRPVRTIVNVGGKTIGASEITVIAGPCAVENYDQLLETAKAVKKAGGAILRGGAFKPRSSPYNFQGLGEAGIKMLADVSKETGLPFVTEVMDTRMVEFVAGYADMLQVVSRNMHNYPLLIEVGKTKKPVLLKRGMMATIE